MTSLCHSPSWQSTQSLIGLSWVEMQQPWGHPNRAVSVRHQQWMLYVYALRQTGSDSLREHPGDCWRWGEGGKVGEAEVAVGVGAALQWSWHVHRANWPCSTYAKAFKHPLIYSDRPSAPLCIKTRRCLKFHLSLSAEAYHHCPGLFLHQAVSKKHSSAGH